MDPTASDISKSPGITEVVKGNLFSFLQILLTVKLNIQNSMKNYLLLIDYASQNTTKCNTKSKHKYPLNWYHSKSLLQTITQQNS